MLRCGAEMHLHRVGHQGPTQPCLTMLLHQRPYHVRITRGVQQQSSTRYTQHHRSCPLLQQRMKSSGSATVLVCTHAPMHGSSSQFWRSQFWLWRSATDSRYCKLIYNNVYSQMWHAAPCQPGGQTHLPLEQGARPAHIRYGPTTPFFVVLALGQSAARSSSRKGEAEGGVVSTK